MFKMRIFNVANKSFSTICENKFIAKISEFTVLTVIFTIMIDTRYSKFLK